MRIQAGSALRPAGQGAVNRIVAFTRHGREISTILTNLSGTNLSGRVFFSLAARKAEYYTRPRGNLGDLLVWDPDLSRVQFIGAGLGVGFHTLGSATGSAALVSSSFFAPSGSGTTLFRLDPAQASTFFANTDLTQAYTLPEPSYLYNTADLKFHLL